MATTIFLINPQTFPSSTSYLLDTYSAAAAYSLRQLKTGVTNVVRVRRSGDNAESDFTADEITDGTLLSWVTASGTQGFVTTWYDQSGNGNDATQVTAGSQPKIVNASAVLTNGGIPTVVFDGTDDGLSAGSIGVSGSSLRSVFSVTNTYALAAAGGGYLGVGGTPSTGTIYDLCPESGQFALRVSGNSIYNYSFSALTQYLISVLQTTTTTAGMNLYIDGSSVSQTSTTTTTLNTTDDWYIGEQPNNTDKFFDGGIQEIIIMASDESANRTDIESDINTYYSIY